NQDEFYDPAQFGPDLSRDFPGLRLWLTFKLFGAARYRAALAEKRALALEAADALRQVPGIVLDAPPQLSLLAFHLAGPALPTRSAQNAATTALLERVTARGDVMITGCTVDGRVLARVCVLSFRTRRRDIEIAVRQIAEETAALIEGTQTPV
ncbi:MAG: hypothetical protein RL625_107, partial [Gemmatimonadota bacterium]